MRRGSRDNVLAGSLVIAAIALAVVTVVLLAGGLDWVSKKPYAVWFPLDVGVPGLAPGSDVQLGGVPVGQVTRVRIEDAGEDGQRLVVRFRIDRRRTLYEGAQVQIVQELLGGTSRLNITSIGDPKAEELSPDAPQEGASGGGMLEKFGLDDLKDKANALLDTWTEVGAEFRVAAARLNEAPEPDGVPWTERIDGFLTFLDEGAPETFASLETEVKGVAEQANTLLGNANKLIDDNREGIGETVKRAERITGRLDQFTEENQAEFEQITKDLAAASASFKEIGADAERFMARFDGSATDPIEEVRRGAVRALSEFEKVLAANRADLRRAISRLRLTADQALDTMLEVRRSPWRLLHRPDERETAYELLYDSARQYARAVSDLHSVTLSMESLANAASGGSITLDDGMVTQLRDRIDESRRRFEGAEDRFLDVLLSIEGGVPDGG